MLLMDAILNKVEQGALAVKIEMTENGEEDIELVAIGTDIEDGSSHNIIPNHYINMQRSIDLTKDLSINSIPPELLSHNIIELASAQNFSHSVTNPPQYYDADFLSQTFTEEEHKLAVAYVSEVMGSKQGLSSPLTLIPSEKSVINSIGSNYINSVESKSENNINLQDEEEDISSHDDHVTEQCNEINYKKIYSTLRHHIPDSVLEENVDRTRSVPLIVSAQTVRVPSNDGFDSEYDNEIQTSRRSLPHKKRIASKLRKALTLTPTNYLHVKSHYKCLKCDEQFTNQSSFALHKLKHTMKRVNYACEICEKICLNQLNFFEHLKSHYEPEIHNVENGMAVDKGCKKAKSKQNEDSLSDDQNKIYQSQELETLPHEESDELNGCDTSIQVPIYEHSEDLTKPKTSRIKLSPDKPAVKEECIHIGDVHSITCGICSKVFRRKKAFDCHMSLSHPKKEDIEEFSEPEDMMEGIRHVVTDIPTCDDEDEHSDEWHPDTKDEPVTETKSDIICSSPCTADVCTSPRPAEVLEKTPESPSTEIPDKEKIKRKKELNCPHCERTFVHRNSLFYHIRAHTGHRPFQCQVCGKSFYAAGALKIHMRFHSGERPYKCDSCDRCFRQWGDLKYHTTSIHSEKKIYQCEYCGKDFARKYSLVVHRRIHTGEKNYICEFCTKTFRASTYLQNHRRIHTGEKPHSCDVCGKPFRVRSDLKRHLKTHGDGIGSRGDTKITNRISTSSSSKLISTKTPQTDESSNNSNITEHGSNTSSNIKLSPTKAMPEAIPLNLNVRTNGNNSSNIFNAENFVRDRNNPDALYVWIANE